MPATPSTIRTFKLLFFAGLLAWGVVPAGAADDPSRDALVQTGLTALYNLDYEGAYRAFRRLETENPDDPLGPYALTTAHWWELTNEFDEKNPELERRFLEAADRTVETARRRRADGKDAAQDLLCLGGALGLKSRWDAIQGHWLRAYRHGKAAYNAQKKALELDPELYDASLGVGIFHYYTSTLPKVVKILARLVFGGNKEEGLREIRLAMTRGRFSRTAARLFLIGIYNNTEKDYDQALALVREGRREFPESSFFHLLELLTLENRREWDALRQGAEDFLARIEEGRPSYRPQYRRRGHYLRGNAFLGEGRYAEALAVYDRVLAEFPSEDRWISLTLLNRGRTHDLLGQRDRALADYRAVLKRRDVWGLHDQARELLDRPSAPPPSP